MGRWYTVLDTKWFICRRELVGGVGGWLSKRVSELAIRDCL